MTPVSLVPLPARYQRADGNARIAFSRAGNLTVLNRLYQDGAAKIRLPETAGRAEAILINTAGGLTGGDRLAWEISLEAGARAAVTTQACEKIYRSLDGLPALVETRITIEAGACLDWLPQETIVFDHSALKRSLAVTLEADSTFLGVESIVFGRHAMGENVSQAMFHDRWRIRRAGRLVFADDLRFDGRVSALIAHAAVCARGRALATVLLVSPDAERHLERLRSHSPALAATAFDGKLLARLVAGDAYGLRQELVPALQFLSGGCRLPKAWAL
jgi:urease accessory protein